MQEESVLLPQQGGDEDKTGYAGHRIDRCHYL
jgi:hypothetical protein